MYRRAASRANSAARGSPVARKRIALASTAEESASAAPVAGALPGPAAGAAPSLSSAVGKKAAHGSADRAGAGDAVRDQAGAAGRAAGAREGRGTLAQYPQRARAVLLLEMHLRQTAIAALGGGKLVDEVAKALFRLAQPALLEALEALLQGDLVIEVRPSHRP